MFILQGMCYSGKTTLGSILARELNVPFLDSRDLFQRIHGMSETEYLTSFGRDKFCEAERETLRQDFGNIVLSLGGSACYYPTEMDSLVKHHTIIWLDVSFEEIKKRMEAEGNPRPIVYLGGVESFRQLYEQRRLLYPLYTTVKISVTEAENPVSTIESILKSIYM